MFPLQTCTRWRLTSKLKPFHPGDKDGLGGVTTRRTAVPGGSQEWQADFRWDLGLFEMLLIPPLQSRKRVQHIILEAHS